MSSPNHTPFSLAALCLSVGLCASTTLAWADPVESENWNLHAQLTSVLQYHPRFASPYEGANSLAAANSAKTTNDLTLFAGLRPWAGGECYLNWELDQGFGLSNTLGMAGFASGEAYKVGASKPYLRVPRMFCRQIVALGATQAAQESGANQLAGSTPTENLTFTVGKFSVVDIFDTNRYAHDPRSDFLNWSIIDAGAFDYAADAWGYTFGVAAEWQRADWALRSGIFNLSKEPNSKELEQGFKQFEWVEEVAHRHTLAAHPGTLKVLAFLNRGRMGRYDAAVAQSAPINIGAVRKYDSRLGLALNLEQEIDADLGAFARASVNQGDKEAFEFTEINRSLSAGIAFKGAQWKRSDDTLGVAVALNGLSSAARRYFAAGGVGILIGDEQLPRYGSEKIVETYYAAKLGTHFTVSADYQFVTHPAYNRDRGPVSIFGLRAHAEM